MSGWQPGALVMAPWQTIDTIPRDGKPVLGCAVDGDGQYAGLPEFVVWQALWCLPACVRAYGSLFPRPVITHWMPLPAPPGLGPSPIAA